MQQLSQDSFCYKNYDTHITQVFLSVYCIK